MVWCALRYWEWLAACSLTLPVFRAGVRGQLAVTLGCCPPGFGGGGGGIDPPGGGVYALHPQSHTSRAEQTQNPQKAHPHPPWGLVAQILFVYAYSSLRHRCKRGGDQCFVPLASLRWLWSSCWPHFAIFVCFYTMFLLWCSTYLFPMPFLLHTYRHTIANTKKTRNCNSRKNDG